MRLYLPIVLLLGLCAYSFAVFQNEELNKTKDDFTQTLESIQDATIKAHGENDNLSQGISPYLDIYALPGCGDPSLARVLLEFDLNLIDPLKEIEEAKLILHNDETPYFKRKHIFGESENEVTVSGLQEAWDEKQVTWENQPKTSKLYRVSAIPSEEETSDFKMDVTELIMEMNVDKNNFFGFLLQLNEETPKRRYAYVSKEYQDKRLAPKLIIKYKKDPFDKERNKLKNLIGKDLEVFPNPSKGIVQIAYEGNLNHSLVIYNANAQEILSWETLPEKHKIDLTNYPEGQYFLHFTDGSTKYIEPIIIQE